MNQHRFRIVKYNIHRCRVLNRRVLAGRIVEVLQEIDADIVDLQEGVSTQGSRRGDGEAAVDADELGGEYRLGQNTELGAVAYGNLLLSRFPVVAAQNYDLSVTEIERRGCLRTDVKLAADNLLHVY